MRSSQYINESMHSKIPPQSRELEEAVLGAVLMESECYNSIASVLSKEKFYVDAHATIWDAFVSLNAKSQPIDLLTVTERLRSLAKLEEVGGAYYLSELTNKVASSANVVYHAHIIVQKFIQRELIRISNDIIRDAYEDTVDVFDLLDVANNKLLSLNNINTTAVKSISQIQTDIKKSLVEKKPLAKSFKLGIDSLDFLSKTFNIIGGYSGTGKTALMCTTASNLAKQGYRIGIFSIEMSKEMLVARMMQEENSISAKKIITDQLSDEDLELVLGQKMLSDSIFVDDSTDITDKNILLKAKVFMIKYDLDFLMIDFMQMIEFVESKKLEVRINEWISKGLQNIAKELDKCIVGLAQLTPTEKNEKPTYKNIRNGGLAEAASDIFLLFDEYAKENNGADWLSIPYIRRGKVTCIYAKGRYTAVGNVDLYFNKPKQIICSWNDKPYETSFAEYVKEEKKQETDEFEIF